MSENEQAFTRYQFAVRLRRLADAVETGNPFTIIVDGKRVQVPVSAIPSIVFEREDGENELEFQLAWKER
jgi:amphi-Trp domain-containing protein